MARRRSPPMPPAEAIAMAVKMRRQFVVRTHGGRAVHVAEAPDLAGAEVLGRDLGRELVWCKLADIARVDILPAPLVAPSKRAPWVPEDRD